MPRLIVCSSCSVHVKRSETQCPHCGNAVTIPDGAVGRAAGAVLMGLTLTGCPDKDEGDTFSDAAAYGVAETGYYETTSTSGSSSSSSSEGTGTGTGTSMTSATDSMTSTSTGTDTGTGTDTDTDTDTEATGTSIGEPEYGVPTTSG